MKLYEIKENMLQIEDMLENEEIEFDSVKDTLDLLEIEFEDKADNIKKLMQNLSSDAEACKQEKMRLEKKQKVLENRVKNLKEYLFHMMKETGKTKFKTQLFSFNIQNSAKQVNKETLDLNLLPDEYFKIIEPQADTAKIKKALSSGIEVPGAELYQPESLVIK